MAALALVGAAFTGCSSDNDGVVSAPQQPAANTGNVEILTTTVSLGDATTRALTDGGAKTFAAGDQIAVIYKNTSDQTVRNISTALTDGDITKEDAVFKKDCWRALTELDAKAREAEEFRKKYPKA